MDYCECPHWKERICRNIKKTASDYIWGLLSECISAWSDRGEKQAAYAELCDLDRLIERVFELSLSANFACDELPSLSQSEKHAAEKLTAQDDKENRLVLVRFFCWIVQSRIESIFYPLDQLLNLQGDTPL